MFGRAKTESAKDAGSADTTKYRCDRGRRQAMVCSGPGRIVFPSRTQVVVSGSTVMFGRAKTESAKDAGSADTGQVSVRPRTPAGDGLQRARADRISVR